MGTVTSGNRSKMGGDILDLEEWTNVRNKMIKYHENITSEVKGMVVEMITAFKPELMGKAETLSKLGQVIEVAIGEMLKLEEEVTALEKQFQGFVGCSWADLDLENLDVDFIEDLMLRAKPTNAILQDIRNRQIVKLDKVKNEYWEKIKELGEEKKVILEEVNEVEKLKDVDESVPPIESANPA